MIITHDSEGNPYKQPIHVEVEQYDYEVWRAYSEELNFDAYGLSEEDAVNEFKIEFDATKQLVRKRGKNSFSNPKEAEKWTEY